MKIGVLTLPLHSNYGGILQAYALQLYLKRRGHSAVLLNRQFGSRSRFRWIRRIIKTLFFRNKLREEKEEEYKKQHINYFIDTYINPKTDSIYSTNDLKKEIDQVGIDAVVVGSDQVWRYEYINKMLPDYFLGFSTSSQFKKISYAASFGKKDWQGNKQSIKQVNPLLKDFDGISVREQSGVKLCENVFNVKAEQHIDPVALLDISDYRDLIKREDEPRREEVLLIYMLDIGLDKKNVIDRIQKSIGGETFSINKPQVNENTPIEEKIYPTVTNWLKGFVDAKYVITDSFHGTIFSLMYNKPFIVYGNRKRGLTRFYSLLEKVDLSHRIIQTSEDLTEEVIHEDIRWEKVNRFLDKEKERTDKYFNKVGL